MTSPRDPHEFGEPDNGLLQDALGGIDFSVLDEGKAGEYRQISGDEIVEADGYYPLKGQLMRLANSALDEARQQANGERSRMPESHDAGWSLAIETPNGYVGLWSCWLRNRFYLGFPKGQEGAVSDELVMKTLGVERARPVRSVGATAVSSMEYLDDFKDPDKPLVENIHGQTVAYKDMGMRQWAKFYGEPVANGGRVWVDYSQWDSNSMHFPVVEDGNRLGNVYYGHEQSNGISTYPFGFHNEYAPDGPTADDDAIQGYKEKFIQLACEIAVRMGGAKRLHIDYGFAMVPEDLTKEGYAVEWKAGTPGVREGWGSEQVVGTKGGETIYLKSGNSLVPWSTIRRMDIPAEMSGANKLGSFILEDGLYF